MLIAATINPTVMMIQTLALIYYVKPSLLTCQYIPR